MKKTYMMPVTQVHKLQIESLMQTISGGDSVTISTGTADSRASRGFGDDE